MLTGKIIFKTVFLSKVLPENRKIDSLIKWGKEFDQLGISPESKGNLSFRSKSGFIITNSGTVLGKLKRDDLAEVIRGEKRDKEFIVYCKGKASPSKESLFHNEIYRLRPEINAIFHLHDNLVLEVASRLEIPCTLKEELPGSYELVQEIKRLLEEHRGVNYFVLKNHGIVALGTSLYKAGRLVKFYHEKAKEVRLF